MSKLTIRTEAVRAVCGGASITSTARRHAISRATLHRWLQAYDRDHPVASLRPKKTGPKAPRWTDEALNQVVDMIADHPDWWGKRRVTTALRGRGATLSEATVSRMLVVARRQLAQAQDREARAQQARRNRQVKTALRRNERDAARAAMWHERLMPALAPGLTAQERWRRVAQALASKRYKIQVKDLTPELRAIADGYIEKLGGRDSISRAEAWLIDARRFLHILKNPEARSPEKWLRAGPNIEHLRVGALNNLVKNFSRNVGLGASPALLEDPDNKECVTSSRRLKPPDAAC